MCVCLNVRRCLRHLTTQPHALSSSVHPHFLSESSFPPHPLSSQYDPLSAFAHDFPPSLFPTAPLLAVVCASVSVCEIVSTARLARPLCVRLVWRKVMGVPSADQQWQDEVTAKL